MQATQQRNSLITHMALGFRQTWCDRLGI